VERGEYEKLETISKVTFQRSLTFKTSCVGCCKETDMDRYLDPTIFVKTGEVHEGGEVSCEM
jgi:hypothetical protein